MNEEIKVRSFRISDSVAEKFKTFCSEFESQNVALDSLITAYEVQNARAILTDRQTDIADYDIHIQAIQSAFLRSLELNENAEQRIRAEFKSLLSSKDETIIQLQSEKAQAQEQTEQYKSAYSTLVKSTEEQLKAMQEQVSKSEKALQSENERANTEQKTREQAERIVAMLTEQVEQLKEQIQSLSDKAIKSDEYKVGLEQSAIEITEHKAEIEHLQTQLRAEQENKEKERIAAEREKETAIKYATAETAGKYQRKIEELQTKQAEQLAILLQSTKNTY